MGDIEVRVRDGALRAVAGVIDTPLLADGGDEFIVDWSGDGGSDKITFLFDASGRAVTLDWAGRKFERK